LARHSDAPKGGAPNANFGINEELSPFSMCAQWIYSCFWLPPKEMEQFPRKPPGGVSAIEKDFY